MKLSIFNGSHRGKNSNSNVIIRWFLDVAERNPIYETETIYLNKVNEHVNAVKKFLDSDMVIVVFPLYTDCMPGLVMAFIEELQTAKGKLQGKKLGFIVHSGFPEAHHSRCVEKYLIWLAKELGCDYMGTAVLGGSEGLRMMSESMTRKKRQLFNKLGEEATRDGIFNPDTVRKITGYERMSTPVQFIFKLLAKTGVTNSYWNNQLKRNNAYANRNARPYA